MKLNSTIEAKENRERYVAEKQIYHFKYVVVVGKKCTKFDT